MAAKAYTNNKNAMRFWKPKGWDQVMAEAAGRNPAKGPDRKAKAVKRGASVPTPQDGSNGKQTWSDN